MNKREFTTKGLVITGLLSTLIACGGGSSSNNDDVPTAGTSVVTKGEIEAIGSIFVNGVKYETPSTGTYVDDDETKTGFTDDDIGKVVTIKGTRNDDGTGEALEVEYEAEVEGAADTATTINGTTILIDDNTNTPATDPALVNNELVSGTRYEVSGYRIGNNTIEATFIKVDDDTDGGVDEVKGRVQAADITSITVHGTVYQFDNSLMTFQAGDFVEIHFNPGTTQATSVELEDNFFDGVGDGQEVEYEGAVNLDGTDLLSCPTGADFLIDSICIDWTSTTQWFDGLVDDTDLVAGLRVEAEGHFNSAGLLVAEKIKGRGNRVRVDSTVSNIGTGTFDLIEGKIQVTTQDGLTEYDMDSGTGNAFGDIVDGEGVEVRGIRTGPSSFLALRVKSKTVNSDRHELRAKVDDDGADDITDTITVMGITSSLGVQTQLEDDDLIIASGGSTTTTQIDVFLASIDDDGIVNSTNGPNDIVEVRIDTTSGDGSAGAAYSADQVEIEREDD